MNRVFGLSSWRRAWVTVVALSFAVLSVLSCSREERGCRLSPGEPVPAFHVVTLSGQDMSESDFTGRRSLIVFFDVWCPDCKSELPELQRVYEYLEGETLILAVARRSDAEAVRQYWSQCGLTFPVSVPGSESVFGLFDRGSKSGVPQGYLTDEDGVVRYCFDSTDRMGVEEICEFLLGDI